MRGDGTLYLRGDVWWASYVVRGRRYRVSTGKDNKREANEWLKEQTSPNNAGTATASNKLTVTDLVTELFKQYDIDGRKTKPKDERRWRLHLEPFFGACLGMDVIRPMIRQYISQRKTELDYRGSLPKNATINRELAILRESFNLSLRDERLRHAPSFKGLTLDESDNVRRGFVKDSQYDALARETAKVGLWLRSLFQIYYDYAWRLKEPLANMRVRMLDFENRLISIDDSKNGEPRTVAMTQKVFELLKACCAGKGQHDYVFTREDGSQVKDFHASWKNVTTAAGCAGLLVHDLRRTGARNMRRAGIDRDTIRKIGGWKTDSMFRRYNIVDEQDLHEAAQKIDRRQEKSQLSHKTPSEQPPTEPQTTILQ